MGSASSDYFQFIMKKATLLLFMLLTAMTGNAVVNEKLRYFSSDFSNPTEEKPLCGWTSFGTMKEAADINLGTSDAPLKDYFPTGSDAYVMLDFKGYGNAPWSNSSFKEGGAADEWLVSPEIDLTEAPANLMLDFDVLCFGSSNECKYEVYVSTTGNSREDFSGKAIFAGRSKSSTREVISTTVHKALKDVGGKKIWIAFVNKSTDAQLTGFSAISVAEYDIDLINHAPSFTTEAGSFEVSADVSIMTPVSCKGFTAAIEGEDGKRQEYFSDKQLSSRYNTYSFAFPEPITVEFGDTYNYTLTVTPNFEGATPTVMQCTLVCHEGYPATCVMEEGTGSWCGYCVRGAAALEYYAATYGDRFIGIGVHNDDPMEVYDYYSSWKAQSGLNSFPSAWINRSIASDPAMGYPLVEAEVIKNVGQRVTIDKVSFNPDSFRATVFYSPEFCINLNNADVTAVAVVTENGVKGTGTGWMQNNNYSNKTLDDWLAEGLPEEMWEYAYDYTLKGSLIISENNPFNHVAMGVYNNYYGDNTTLPSVWEAGIPQQYSLTFDFPMQKEANTGGVQDWHNTAIIVLLLDKASGHILNADRLNASEYSIEVSSVENTTEMHLAVTKCQEGIMVNTNENTRIDVFGIDGRLIKTATATSGTCIIPTDGLKGIVSVRAVNGKNTVIKKIIL